MSDRRPEPKLIVPCESCQEYDDIPCGHIATPSELVDELRRGVESGEIEGLPLFCAAHWCALTPDESTCSLYQRVEGMDTCSIEYRILLIPTTDSERHP